jgi:hypothetical protein
MTTDLGLAIVVWAERKARQSRLPVWSYVMQILVCGSTSAISFCAEHMPKNGWQKTSIAMPLAGRIVLASEGIGCIVGKYQWIDNQWYSVRQRAGKAKAEKVNYSPSWWKNL